MVSNQSPDAIVHVAAIIAPTAYIIPEMAYKVNVLGTQYLIEAAENIDNFNRFVFVSSYSIHGPRNPHKNLPPITGETPTDARDNYGKHKEFGEKRLEDSDLSWTIVRLPAVFSLDTEFGSGDEFLKFGFLLDPTRNESAIDARDAGLAIANAVTTDAVGRKFEICGDPGKGWTGKAKDLQAELMNARGLSSFPNNAYRHADPEVDESWYFEDIVDPTESQKILQYQRYSFEDYINQIKEQAGFSRYILKVIGPLIKFFLVRKSPYHGNSIEYESRPIWEAIKEHFDLDESNLPVFSLD